MDKLKYLVISVLAFVLTIWVQLPIAAQPPAELTEIGHQLLGQGQPQDAYEIWTKALKGYQQEKKPEAILGTRINQAIALTAMGQNPRACNTLTRALELEDALCDPQIPTLEQAVRDELDQLPKQPITALALQTLGDTLTGLGKAEASLPVLSHAMQTGVNSSMDTTAIQLSLANAYTALYEQKLNQYQLSEAYRSIADPDQSLQATAQAAMNLYGNLSGHANPRISLKAQVNCLTLSQSLDPTVPQLKALAEDSKSRMPSMVEAIQQQEFNQLSTIDAIYARLKFANSLSIWGQHLSLANEHIQTASLSAQRLKNKRAIAASAYQLGKLYRIQGKPDQAVRELGQGASLAASIQAWDLAYQSNGLLAQLLQDQGNVQRSQIAYQAAISNLEQVRSSLLAVDHPFSFREEIEPIHRKYMQLLLSAPKPDLKSVITTNEQLQIAQVENFLRCGRLDVVSLEELREETETPTVIHILQLGDQIETLVSTDRGIFRHSAPAAPIIEQLGFLSINIETAFDRTGAVVLDYASALYDELITPIQPYLPKTGTLVFVLDEDFQGVPMAMLWDGQKFLIEKYSIANALGSKVARPQPLPPEDLKVLFAGLSEISPSQQESNEFAPEQSLPFVAEEVKQVGTYSDTNLLINDAFTSERFQNTLNQTDVPILHISTHGQFSSRIEDTLIWAWDQPITLREMETILRRKGDSEPLNLLVLSACETAEGDRRATLGLAGIAAQVGARSTLASLWIVDDSSTATFMASFYEQLQEGKTKAAALRTAQLSLINSDNYRHPFYWASFILVGSWV